jgi:hypothetical protein
MSGKPVLEYYGRAIPGHTAWVAFKSALKYFAILFIAACIVRFMFFGIDGDERLTPAGHLLDALLSLGLPFCIAVLHYWHLRR